MNLKIFQKNKVLYCFSVLTFLLTSCDLTSPINNRIVKIQEYITEQNYIKATQEYEKILKKKLDPDIEIKIRYQLANIYSIYLGNYQHAKTHLLKIQNITLDPFWLVKTEEELGNINLNQLLIYNESAKNYINLVKVRPKLREFDTYQLNLALSYYKAKEYKNAIIEFNKLKKNPNHAYYIDAIYYLGKINFDKQEWNKAISFFTIYISKETNKDSIFNAKYLIANSYESMEMLNEAYKTYYSILRDHPNTEVVRKRLSSIYNRKVARKR